MVEIEIKTGSSRLVGLSTSHHEKGFILDSGVAHTIARTLAGISMPIATSLGCRCIPIGGGLSWVTVRGVT
jgi:hypothetical protein